jgi:cytidylate kinase
MEELRLDRQEAEREIARSDSSIHAFIKRYFDAELNDPLHYDVVVNTGHINFEAAASIISDAVSLKD